MMAPFKHLSLSLLFSFICLLSYGQIEKKYAELLTVTKIDTTANFNKIAGGYPILISDITGDKSKIKLSHGTDTLPGSSVLGPTQQQFEMKPFLTGAGPIEFTLTLDNGKKIPVKITNDTSNTSIVNTPPPPARNFRTRVSDEIKRVNGLNMKEGIIRYDPKRNICYQKNIIHIFLDENGEFYLSGLPTTAREDNIFKVHVFYESGGNTTFTMETVGVYDPTFEVYGAVANNGATANAAEDRILQKDFAPVGPFTRTLQIKVTKKKNGQETVILDKTISIAKLHKITLTAGLYGSFLKSPENITTLVKPNGDTTLTADNPNTRGFINVMLGFYPWPRNILLPSHDWKERFSFSVGTSINKQLAENFFAGINYDIAMGLALSFGAHYGSRQYVVGYPNFKYGEDKFSGSLEGRVKKEYSINCFVGVSLDFRLLGYIFQNPGAATGVAP
jgi:hypothetical protein